MPSRPLRIVRAGMYVCMYVCMVRLFVVSCIRSIKDRSRVLTPKLTVVDQRGLITDP